MLVSRNCLNCTAEFKTEAREVNRGNGKFCNNSCSSAYMHKQNPRSNKIPNVSCAWCSKSFYRTESSLKKSRSGLFFCCREHKDSAQRIGGIKEIMPSHYGSQHPTTYRKTAFENLPAKCAVCGWDEYPEVLHVHHIDCDRSNNSPSNLQIVCPTHHEVNHFLTQTGRWRPK